VPRTARQGRNLQTVVAIRGSQSCGDRSEGPVALPAPLPDPARQIEVPAALRLKKEARRSRGRIHARRRDIRKQSLATFRVRFQPAVHAASRRSARDSPARCLAASPIGASPGLSYPDRHQARSAHRGAQPWAEDACAKEAIRSCRRCSRDTRGSRQCDDNALRCRYRVRGAHRNSVTSGASHHRRRLWNLAFGLGSSRCVSRAARGPHPCA
jgi:hypothetical protein